MAGRCAQARALGSSRPPGKAMHSNAHSLLVRARQQQSLFFLQLRSSRHGLDGRRKESLGEATAGRSNRDRGNRCTPTSFGPITCVASLLLACCPNGARGEFWSTNPPRPCAAGSWTSWSTRRARPARRAVVHVEIHMDARPALPGAFHVVPGRNGATSLADEDVNNPDGQQTQEDSSDDDQAPGDA